MTTEESATSNVPKEDPLTAEELKILSEIDSTHFGFLKINAPENATKKALIIKAIKCLENVVIDFLKSGKPEAKILKGKKFISGDENFFSPETKLHTELITNIYCKLGHFNLLLEEYSKALSSYQKYFTLKEEHWKNSAFMYGLGLTYFHFNSFKWAIKTFQHLLYVDPGFKCSNEIHLRLALIFKVLEEYETSYKHFQLVLVDSSPCSASKAEINFHIAHLYQIQGKHKSAKEAYEQLLEIKDLSLSIKAEVFKQLGWMHHRFETLVDKPTGI